MKALLVACSALVTIAGVAGCSDGRKGPAALPTSRAKPRSVFVVVGGRESAGVNGLPDSLHTSWPQVVYSKDRPTGTVYVNVAREDSTVAAALTEQVPLATEQRPTLIAVWLGEGDDDIGTTPARFGRDLRTLLGRLRRRGTPRVLVASPPPGVPGARFATEIADAAKATGAETVALTASAWNPRAPDSGKVAVQAAAAEQFGEALKR